MPTLTVCCFVALLHPAVCLTRYIIYHKENLSTEIGVTSQVDAVSKLDCAAICMESGICKSSQFNKNTKRCRMSSVSLAAPDNRGAVYSMGCMVIFTGLETHTPYSIRVYEFPGRGKLPYTLEHTQTTNNVLVTQRSTARRMDLLALTDSSGATKKTTDQPTKDDTTKNCTANEGYFLRTYDDMQLCLKYNSSKMNHTVATSTCENDGAHLVLIESLAVRQRIKETLTELKITDPIWIDGFDRNNTNEFLSWKGEPLAWIEWATHNPDDKGGDNCLLGKPFDGYKHRDALCYIEHTVLCQIDV